MKVNPQQLLDDGYIILREVVPMGQLDELRDCFETLVERQKVIWAREREPDDPPGGYWETAAQPRVFFDGVSDEITAKAIEFCLHENTLGGQPATDAGTGGCPDADGAYVQSGARSRSRELASRY